MQQTPIVVVGAGVMGLSVATRLAETGHRVQVLARELPLETTSMRAAAIWYPYLIEPPERALGWSETSLQTFTSLADEADTGVVMRSGVEYLDEPLDSPWWASVVPGLSHPAHVPAPYRDAWTFVAPVIEMPVYLRWLQSRLETLGVAISRVDLAALPSEPRVVVNCSGLGSRVLVGDESVRPVRGQTLVVSQIGLETWILDESRLTYVIPRSRDIVVGGTDDDGSWDITPDPSVASQLLGRATALEPRLAEAEVISHQVGLRPARSEVRLEVEPLSGDRYVVHCYGHGGAGVTVSWGCADEVVALIDEQIPRQ
jgi:D-amino-acid oxidase